MEVLYKYESLTKENLTKFYDVDKKYIVAVDKDGPRIICSNTTLPTNLKAFFKEMLSLI